MALNKVEDYLKSNGGFASIKTLKKKLGLNKKQVLHYIHNSFCLKPVDPILCGSGKVFIPVFKYFEYPNAKIEYYKRLYLLRKTNRNKKVEIQNPTETKEVIINDEEENNWTVV